jgi:hypothetical protein
MKRRLLRLTMALWLAMCLTVTGAWAIGRIFIDPLPRPLIDRWLYRLNGRSARSIGVAIFHDYATPNVGPQFGPNLTYTPPLLDWYNRQPTGRYFRAWGFAFSYDTNFEIDSSRHMFARGRIYRLSMPYWTAWAMWLPVAIYGDRLRRQRIRNGRRLKGQCMECGYDLRATPDRCPECGTLTRYTPSSSARSDSSP